MCIRDSIHTAEMRDFDGIAYYNDGDWVEGCNALVEHFDGTMEILHWSDEIAKREPLAESSQEPDQAETLEAA